MIKKIICPTDFSDVAQNAIAYAAKLCQLTSVPLELLHIEPVLIADQLFTPRKISDDIHEVSQELNNVCKQINTSFGISCGVNIDTSGSGIGEAIGDVADKENLVVIGTNGADSFDQKIFGSNALQVVKQAYPFTMVIPDKVEFATIKTIVYAWDYEITKPEINRIISLAEQFGSKLIFLHISEKDTTISKDVFNGFTQRIHDEFQLDGQLECRRIFNSDPMSGLRTFIRQEDAQVLFLSIKSGKYIRKLLQGGSGGAELPTFPLLIMHHD